MPHLLYSAKDAEGKPVEGFVQAASAESAREQLLAQGLADVVLHQEPALAQNSRDFVGMTEEQVRQLARLKLAAIRNPGLKTVWTEVARTRKGWLLVDLAMATWGVYSGTLYLVVAAAAFAAWPFALAAWQFRHGDRYLQLMKAFSVGDWHRVRALAARLREVTRGEARLQLDFDLDVRLAYMLARAGELQQALASVAPWRARLEATPGFFESRVAIVHAAAGDRAGFVQCMEDAWNASGREPGRTLDFALAHARFGDPTRAHELLAGVDLGLLPPHASAFMYWARGLVRLRLNLGLPEALDLLARALAEFLQRSQQPAVWPALAFCTCDHAVALSQSGQKDAARRELAQVWPIVSAHADKALLRLLQADGLAPE